MQDCIVGISSDGEKECFLSQQPPEERTGPSRRPRRALVALLGLLVLLGAAGGTIWYRQSTRHAEQPITMAANAIPGAPEMPDWLMTASPLIKTEYVWAAAHLHELQYIPCYCGCGSSGHTDNFACYYQRDAGGKILGYDQMGFG